METTFQDTPPVVDPAEGENPTPYNEPPNEEQPPVIDPPEQEQLAQEEPADMLPGGITGENLVLSVGYDDEMEKADFDDLLETVIIDDSMSGEATVVRDIRGPNYNRRGRYYGTVSARLIGDHHSRIYVFRHDDLEKNITTFTAKFTPTPA